MGKSGKKNKSSKTETQKCAVEDSSTKINCSNSTKNTNCSKEQEVIKHGGDSAPFLVQTNEVLGRFLTAARDIKQGELILKETPAVVGPSIQAAPLCLKCYKPILPFKKPVSCLQCWIAPICSPVCNGSGHSPEECSKFKSTAHLKPDFLLQHFQIITPLRCLLLRENEPEKWKMLMGMEAHMAKRRDTPIWRNHKINVEDILCSYGFITEYEVKDELIQKICGILDVNTFELRIPGFEALNNNVEYLRGVYLQAAMMAHDCIGNTHLAVDDNFNLIVHASVPIKKGDPIYFNYTSVLHGTFERQEHLTEGKYFNCACKRCSDPTEFGTYLSSIICVKCHKGLVIPTKCTGNIYAHETEWKCCTTVCDYKCRGSMIKSAVNYAKELTNDIDKSDIRSVELLIKKLQSSFSPQHSLILDLKQCLIGLYSQFLQQETNPNRKFLLKKFELCKDLLSVLNILEPGISRLKGITLYEMNAPIVLMANKEYDSGEISAENHLKKLLEAEDILKKAISCLLYEPNASPEGRLNLRALKELKMLRNLISGVEKIVATKKQVNEKRRKNKK